VNISNPLNLCHSRPQVAPVGGGAHADYSDEDDGSYGLKPIGRAGAAGGGEEEREREELRKDRKRERERERRLENKYDRYMQYIYRYIYRYL